MLFVLQRLTAIVMVPLVTVHLGMIVYAVRGGLSAGEILDRTEGNVLWALFYGLFVVAAAIHAPIGVANVLKEWTRLPRRVIALATALFALLLLALGLRAVAAVTGWWA